jgi:hypothetical protein
MSHRRRNAGRGRCGRALRSQSLYCAEVRRGDSHIHQAPYAGPSSSSHALLLDVHVALTRAVIAPEYANRHPESLF